MGERWEVMPGLTRRIEPRRMENWLWWERRRPCKWCGGRGGTIEHIVPRSAGGHMVQSNLKAACLRCNNGRDVCGQCIGAFACALAVIGNDASLAKVAKWWNSSRGSMIRFEQTCEGFPEQYDAFDGQGRQVGYLRYRHGNFTVECPDADGELVHEEKLGGGDGIFTEEERARCLADARVAIAQWTGKAT